MTFEGGTDAAALEAYMEHLLAPTLGEGQVVVLDGLGAQDRQGEGAHRSEGSRAVVLAVLLA